MKFFGVTPIGGVVTGNMGASVNFSGHLPVGAVQSGHSPGGGIIGDTPTGNFCGIVGASFK